MKLEVLWKDIFSHNASVPAFDISVRVHVTIDVMFHIESARSSLFYLHGFIPMGGQHILGDPL